MKKTIVNIENSPRETKGEFNLFKILENYVQEVGNINFKILIKKHNEDLLEDLNSKIKSLEEEIKNNSSEEKEKILLDCKEHLKAFTLPKEERKLYTLTSEKFSTYFAITSVSIFTISSSFKSAKLVCCIVCGIISTENTVFSRLAIVRLIPFIAIEPL